MIALKAVQTEAAPAVQQSKEQADTPAMTARVAQYLIAFGNNSRAADTLKPKSFRIRSRAKMHRSIALRKCRPKMQRRASLMQTWLLIRESGRMRNCSQGLYGDWFNASVQISRPQLIIHISLHRYTFRCASKAFIRGDVSMKNARLCGPFLWQFLLPG